MSDTEDVDETSRLLPAIPHRTYVYADELVIKYLVKLNPALMDTNF